MAVVVLCDPGTTGSGVVGIGNLKHWDPDWQPPPNTWADVCVYVCMCVCVGHYLIQ